MSDKFIYENHLGLRFEEECVYLNQSELRDYSWSYDAINSRISRFYRPVTNRKIPLVVAGLNNDEAIAAKHRLLELAETDIEAILPGKIYIGEYYTKGFITASTKSGYTRHKRFCGINLTLTSDDPSWYRERTHSFFPTTDSVVSDSGTDYPYDFPFDYVTTQIGGDIVCDSIRSNAFRIRIYGEIENPSITIGGHVYSIDGAIGSGETLLIDSLTKTITLTKADGEKVNWFNNRNRESYIFQEIPSGEHTVIWNGTFGFDLTIIEKRSEPKWT